MEGTLVLSDSDPESDKASEIIAMGLPLLAVSYDPKCACILLPHVIPRIHTWCTSTTLDH
eukprot:12998183-Ditylum_brightwellii.AAC.1